MTLHALALIFWLVRSLARALAHAHSLHIVWSMLSVQHMTRKSIYMYIISMWFDTNECHTIRWQNQTIHFSGYTLNIYSYKYVRKTINANEKRMKEERKFKSTLFMYVSQFTFFFFMFFYSCIKTIVDEIIFVIFCCDRFYWYNNSIVGNLCALHINSFINKVRQKSILDPNKFGKLPLKIKSASIKKISKIKL